MDRVADLVAGLGDTASICRLRPGEGALRQQITVTRRRSEQKSFTEEDPEGSTTVTAAVRTAAGDILPDAVDTTVVEAGAEPETGAGAEYTVVNANSVPAVVTTHRMVVPTRETTTGIAAAVTANGAPAETGNVTVADESR